jgi:hypothetical protein
MLDEIRRRIGIHRTARGGRGFDNILGGTSAGAGSNLESILGRVLRNLENMTINLTLNNDIDGYRVNQATAKHQARRLSTFI